MTYAPINCTCAICVSMCSRLSCIPTPDEARALVRVDPERMAIYRDMTDEPVEYVAPAMTDGRCTFLRNGRCELHGCGKPTQGRLASHDRPEAPLRAYMLGLWAKADVTDLIAKREHA